jgi:hypothetical protein
MGLIYQLSTPLESPEGITVTHYNIFRNDSETFRTTPPDVLAPLCIPKADVYMAACNADGSEVTHLDAQGRDLPVLSTLRRFKFGDLNQAQKDAHKALLRAHYEYMQAMGELPAGSIIDV